jgi:hypothetical protein
MKTARNFPRAHDRAPRRPRCPIWTLIKFAHRAEGPIESVLLSFSRYEPDTILILAVGQT